MKLLFIRHGDPDYTIDSLTEKGWKEAEFLSEKIAALDVRDFYVSPQEAGCHQGEEDLLLSWALPIKPEEQPQNVSGSENLT